MDTILAATIDNAMFPPIIDLPKLTGFYMHLGITTSEDLEANYESLFLPALAGFVISFLVAKILLSVWDAAATTSKICCFHKILFF